MDKRKNRIKRLCLLGAICAVFGIGTTIALAAPGGEDDPIISKSYIDNVVIPKITQYVDSKLSGITGGTSGNTDSSATAFKVVEVKNGQTLIANEGCEMILRMGSAKIISTEKGGIADTTSGYDLANGSDMPSNHLLVVPLADGRGFIATSDVLVMVKGGYNINQ